MAFLNRKIMIYGVLSALAILAQPRVAWASPEPTLLERYALAERFLAQNADRYVRNGAISVHWIGQEDAFWYIHVDEAGMRHFVRIDATTGRRAPAFDHANVAAGLQALMGKPVAGEALPFDDFRYDRAQSSIYFTVEDVDYRCSRSIAQCDRVAAPANDPREVPSPDGKWAVYSRDNNLWLREVATEARTPLTTDGEVHYAYGAPAGQNTHFISDMRAGINQQPLISWSPDSQRILTHKMDLRRVRDMVLTQAAPDDGSIGPKHWHYRAALGSDANWPISMPVIVDIKQRTVTPVSLPPVRDDLDSNIELQFVWWSLNGDRIYFIEREPYYKQVHLHRIDPLTGQATRLITESSKTFVHIAEDYGWPKVRVTRANDIFWYSERDGYGHLYRYDAQGKLRCRLTSGAWTVREIVRIDEDQKRIFFLASGKEAGVNPYFLNLYSVGFDCKGLQRLTPEPANHAIAFTPRTAEYYNHANGLSPFSPTNSLSPSGRYFVDTVSAPDRAPVTVLRTSQGKRVSTVETADTSKLTAAGFVMPEPFSVMARDGKSRLYGTLFKPSHFDPNRRYPIIDSIYMGPQIPRVMQDFVPSLFDWNSSPTQALAELGFIVVTLNARGEPYRSKQDYDFAYGANLSGSGNLIDHVDAIKALAQTRPYMDIDRVGVTGNSSGGYTAARAMLKYPDFFKVGVAQSGVHDPMNYIPWYTTFIGPDLSAKDLAALSNSMIADQLKGKLLIMHGEMDDNVHPTASIALAESLLNNRKPFDFLLVPNANHDGTAYRGVVLKRRWDYFIEHLRREDPMPYDIPDAF